MELLVLIFKDNFNVRIVDDLPPVFIDGEETFTRVDDNDFNGFYDWLCIDRKKIIGLNYYPFQPEVGLSLCKFPYVRTHVAEGGDYTLTCYFSHEGKEVFDFTIAQAFGKNYCYRSDRGTCLLSFGLPSDFDRTFLENNMIFR